MIYLASPYTHKESAIVLSRYLATVRVMSRLLNQGLFVYSPIVHCHVIATEHAMQTDYLFWMSYNDHFIDLASELFVLCLLGWEDSKGVAHEIEYARSRSIPIRFIDPSGKEKQNVNNSSQPPTK